MLCGGLCGRFQCLLLCRLWCRYNPELATLSRDRNSLLLHCGIWGTCDDARRGNPSFLARDALLESESGRDRTLGPVDTRNVGARLVFWPFDFGNAARHSAVIQTTNIASLRAVVRMQFRPLISPMEPEVCGRALPGMSITHFCMRVALSCCSTHASAPC